MKSVDRGWYHVLDYTKFDEANEVLTKRIGITANKNISYQRHFHRSEVWTIINGTGLFVLNDIIRVLYSPTSIQSRRLMVSMDVSPLLN